MAWSLSERPEREETNEPGFKLYYGIPGQNDHTEGIDYKKPIPIDQFLQGRDSTPKEVVDLRSQFFAQKGLKKTVSIPFEKGTLFAKPNTSLINRSDEPIISFYPDNTEYNVANMQNLNDLALINQTFTTVAGAGAALAGARPQTQHVVLNKPGTQVKLPVTPNMKQDMVRLSKIWDRVHGLSRFKTVPSDIVKGPFPSWQSQNIPQTGLSKDVSAIAQRTNAQYSGDDGLVPEWLFSYKGTQFDKYRSDKLGLDAPKFDNPQQERNWFAKVTYPRVKDEVLAQGGTELQAKAIYEDHRKNFLPYAKGGSGMVATISELNRMAEKYAKGIQLRTETYTKDGEEYYRWRFKDKDGKHTRWDLKRVDVDGIVREYSKTQWAKDHIIPVMDKKRIGGGYIGADNEFNLEPLLQFLNIQKSNTTQLYPGLLKESGVPETFSEYINMKLYPQNYEGMFVPQKWVENFQKIVLAEYYEKTQGLQSANKKKAVMEKLIRLHSARFKDPAIVRGLEMMEEAIGQQVMKNMEEGVAAGNEVPAWIGLLQKPPGGWNSKDPWWTSLSKDAQTRYKYIYDYNQRTILKEPYKRPPFRQDRKDE